MSTLAPLLAGKRRWVERHMNTTISVGGDLDDSVAQALFASISNDEARFSRFRPDSELAQLAVGDLEFDRASADLRHLLMLCDNLRVATEGWFEYEPRRRSSDPTDPILDPNAFAKGWIVGRAARVARVAGARNLVINAGGDVIVDAIDPTLPACRVGIRHPENPSAVAAVLGIRHGAVATSGTYERGDHIRGHRGATASVTVIGPDLGIADALSTAVFATGLGTRIPAWWTTFEQSYSLIVIDSQMRLAATEPAARMIIT